MFNGMDSKKTSVCMAVVLIDQTSDFNSEIIDLLQPVLHSGFVLLISHNVLNSRHLITSSIVPVSANVVGTTVRKVSVLSPSTEDIVNYVDAVSLLADSAPSSFLIYGL
jgi:hypothetical protein